MPKLRVINGTPAPDTPAERVRQKMRDKAYKHMPSCRNCGGSETVSAKIGNVRNNLCVACLMQGRRVVVE